MRKLKEFPKTGGMSISLALIVVLEFTYHKVAGEHLPTEVAMASVFLIILGVQALVRKL